MNSNQRPFTIRSTPPVKRLGVTSTYPPAANQDKQVILVKKSRNGQSRKAQNSVRPGTMQLPGDTLSNRTTERIFKTELIGGLSLITLSDNAAYNSVTDHFYGYSFSLGGLPSYSQLTAVWQEYRILEAELIIMPSKTVNTAYYDSGISAQLQSTVPSCFLAYDPTDDTAATSISELFQYSNCREYLLDKTVKVRCTPMFSAEVYEGPVSTGYQPSTGWLSTADPGVPHYGFKACIRSTGQCTTTLSPYVRLVLEFKATQ